MQEKAGILAEGAYATANGKTAHGLVRCSQRFAICGVIDSTIAGRDAGEIIDGVPCGIPIYRSLEALVTVHPDMRYLIIGVATEGGYLPESYRGIVEQALASRLHLVNGLHQFLSDDPVFSCLAKHYQVDLVDVRKIFSNHKVFYSGKIQDVLAMKAVVLGTDSIVGKRTTAIMLHQAFQRMGIASTFVGMGQTGWMQGFKHCIVMDAIVLDFVTGAIEDIIWRAWQDGHPEVIVTHGEGAFFHPAYPGGGDLLAAARPEYILLQHVPNRKHFVFFPGYEIPPLEKYIQLIELLSGKKPLAITLHVEDASQEDTLQMARQIEEMVGIMTRVPAYQGMEEIALSIRHHASQRSQFGSPNLTRQSNISAFHADELHEDVLRYIAGGQGDAGHIFPQDK